LLAESAKRVLACAAAPVEMENNDQSPVDQARKDVEPDGLVADVEIGEPTRKLSKERSGASNGPNENFIEASPPSNRKFHRYLTRYWMRPASIVGKSLASSVQSRERVLSLVWHSRNWRKQSVSVYCIDYYRTPASAGR
jgi:hypothetical protein